MSGRLSPEEQRMVDAHREQLISLKGPDSVPSAGRFVEKKRVNPKKVRSARRERAGYPSAEEFSFKAWTIPQGLGQQTKKVMRYCAERSDGATVYRKSPEEVNESIAQAREKKRARLYDAKRKGAA